MSPTKKQKQAGKELLEYWASATEEQKAALTAFGKRNLSDRKESRNEGRRVARQARKPGNACACCRYRHWPVLHVHHVNPVNESGFANEGLLWKLCPNCHAYVHELRRYRDKPLYEKIFRQIVVMYSPDAAKQIEFLANIQSREEVYLYGKQPEFVSQYSDEHYELYYSSRSSYDDD